MITRIEAPRLTVPDRDIPTKQAQPRQNQRIFAQVPANIRITEPILIEVVIRIEERGEVMVYGETTRILGGNIALEDAQILAIAILEQWEFEPTYMGEQAVVQEYYVQLNIAEN
ncbi:hypothetical protein K4A83_07655 [Spirulina subsalsa FACHB-351]|uniref:Uncharacterized protein n=1 Tax=Spirulina subsalsa FACHB-351 TaxID=234711 RepID=A0ABT3L3Q7_9CYAN|nr:hypothetical protein [Spirulina subsalsa]MCW6036146.1 hypothetical protein [Spirulina subsalsa FACHB-351]